MHVGRDAQILPAGGGRTEDVADVDGDPPATADVIVVHRRGRRGRRRRRGGVARDDGRSAHQQTVGADGVAQRNRRSRRRQ